MDLTWTVEQEGGASMVRCRVYNDEAVPRRVRLDSRLDGPVLPPRRGGVPEAGWDTTGVVVRLAAGESRALGFAVPADPVKPPVEICEVETATDAETGHAPSEDGQSPTSLSDTPALVAIRTLGDHRPPRDTVVDDIPAATGDGDEDVVRVGDADSDAITDDQESDDGSAVDPPTNPDRCASAGHVDSTDDATVPMAVDEWLSAVADRVERAERLTDADLATATAVVEETDGIDELADLDCRIDTDAEHLRTVSERTAALAARVEATDVPIGALERLA